ncbi:acyl-coA dehydrogenase [Aeropyrum globular virus 1]|uniref:acyl-coA dehydrogenase n=1 Tax=Aeropyrum globular virus 1 TaxID=1932713 RepID=UPI000C7ED0B7|nr:acyl-coA dehydrogenase [Aeropyrum globular virus 1]BBC20949.1 acyl-coA dehydrogenase [Aeropyrum globular virus 1]
MPGVVITPLTAREFLLGLLWLGPRTPEEIRLAAEEYSKHNVVLYTPQRINKAIEHFQAAGLARLENGRLVLERERLHPSLRQAAKVLAQAIDGGDGDGRGRDSVQPPH